MSRPLVILRDDQIRGKCVHANSQIAARNIILTNRVFRVTPGESRILAQTSLKSRLVRFGNGCCLPLGDICFVQHDTTPNCELFLNVGMESVMLMSSKDIEYGEELTLNRNTIDPCWMLDI